MEIWAFKLVYVYKCTVPVHAAYQIYVLLNKLHVNAYVKTSLCQHVQFNIALYSFSDFDEFQTRFAVILSYPLLHKKDTTIYSYFEFKKLQDTKPQCILDSTCCAKLSEL